ncbi:hypothetical protein GTP58_08215 [Duganella sp. CY15W]|uniref:hypothetical protein n=1 Tax=Duganella sp. CY15W TaxID=2692172 RepID=UPI00136D2AF7|nr:hypothetical protein [Duganella sp. CY15W]MYM28306.1 hypothetical protein [Duganella sp. CY15W]
MNNKFDEFTEEAIVKYQELLPAELIRKTFEILASESSNLGEGPDNVFAGAGGRQYQIDTFKLASGIAGIVGVFVTPTSAVLVGLAVVTAIATISESVRQITVDQGALCQALYDAGRWTNRRVLNSADLKKKLRDLTDNEEALDSRYDNAIDTLLSMRVIDLDIINEKVELVETILFIR